MMRRALAAACALALLAPPAGAAPPFVATQPVARQDYWQMRQAAITATLRDTADLSPVKLVFLGDSITDFWLLGANPWAKGQRFGRAIWDQSFTGSVPANRALNLGISGDRIEHVLFRLLPAADGGLGELDRADLNPDFVVLLLGINNSYNAETPADAAIFAGITAVVDAVHARKPGTVILLQSLLPTADADKNRDIVGPVNAQLRALAARAPYNRYVRFFDLHAGFVDASGAQIGALFNDALHPNEAGYAVWRDRLVPELAKARRR